MIHVSCIKLFSCQDTMRTLLFLLNFIRSTSQAESEDPHLLSEVATVNSDEIAVYKVATVSQ